MPPGSSLRFGMLDRAKITAICRMAGPHTQNQRKISCFVVDALLTAEMHLTKPEVCFRWLIALERDVHDPADQVRAGDQAAEDSGRETKFVPRRIAQQRAEDDRHARGKQDHHAEVGRHRTLRPVARSTASRSTSAFKSPLTMRNVLPYS